MTIVGDSSIDGSIAVAGLLHHNQPTTWHPSSPSALPAYRFSFSFEMESDRWVLQVHIFLEKRGHGA
ncbi:hypothetical protein LWI28_006499 [Acer negundo]|uniref:Uncharacterized protein n=1 Tax=Acer negundo TaxID=4023 RepID=A0AAD5IPB9_ACENE|nr:hypothetical protein LWI28_006499 [Acer negundo]